METLFYIDTKLAVFQFLSVLDLIRTQIALPRMEIPHKVLQRELVACVDHRLQKIFKENCHHLKAFLNETGGLISGSFLIQCLHDEQYNTDLDIFYPHDALERAQQFVADLN